jgi:protein SCO1/2
MGFTMKNKSWITFIGIILGLSLVSWWGIPRLVPYTFHGTVLQSKSEAHEFTLTSHTGHRVRLSDYRGKLVLLYFGYTFCPDVCPATLYEIAGAIEILDEEAQDVQLIMVSVDPERDTPAKLAEYMAYFNPSFLGVSGTPEQIAEIATFFGIYYEKNQGSDATGYLVDHTATVIVVDQDGHVKLIFPYGTTAEAMAADLEYLLRH